MSDEPSEYMKAAIERNRKRHADWKYEQYKKSARASEAGSFADTMTRKEYDEHIKQDDDSVVHETSGHKAHEGDHTKDSDKHPGSSLEAQSDS